MTAMGKGESSARGQLLTIKEKNYGSNNEFTAESVCRNIQEV